METKLSDADRAWIVEQIVLRQGRCACGMSESEQSAMPHLVGKFKDLGDGDINKGIRIFSRAVESVVSWQRFGERVGGKVAVVLFVGIAGGIGTLLVLGCKEWIKKIFQVGP